ncbi:PREDICTED: uncharacterized protein LOC106820151, partial [Priapulus caudatus]|uniref:Uncharacterized protein LOC106820151 n=1 Tax=Priapulus caudatus TaxID=37621 RepID=A0ABM1F6W2_PRICU
MNGQSPRVVLGIGYDYPRHDNFQILNVTTSCSEYCSGMFVYIRFYDDFRGKLTLLADQNETLCQHEWDNKRARFYVPFFGCGTTEEIVTFDHFKREVIYEYRNVIFLEERPPEKEDALNKQYYPHHNLPYKGVTRQIEIFCRVWESQREDMLEDLNDFRA